MRYSTRLEPVSLFSLFSILKLINQTSLRWVKYGVTVTGLSGLGLLMHKD